MSTLRAPRTVWRLALTACHIALGLGLSALVVPLLATSTRERLRHWWSLKLLGALGVRLAHEGEAIPPGSLIVANHVSWLDVFAINAVAPATFVCKTEVRNWPVIGWLVARNGTLFLDRGSRAAALEMNRSLQAALAEGRSVAIFPEGTSSDGAQVLPFYAALLQPAVDAACPVVPICVRHQGANGRRSLAPAYCDDISFAQSMLAIAGSDGLETQVIVFRSLFSNRKTRRELADETREVIASHLARIEQRSEPETPCDLPGVPQSDSRPTDSPSPAPAAFLRA